MPFAKGNQYRIEPESDRPMNGRIELRLDADIEKKIKELPDWRDRVRQLLKNWVESRNHPDLP